MHRAASVWQRRPEHPEELAPLDHIRRNSEASRLYLREGGETYRVGEWFRNPDYGGSLRHLDAHGADDFYQGEMAERMVRDIKTHGGLVTRADFQEYALPPRDGVHGSFGDFEIASAPTPHGGGPTVVAILKNMEIFRDEPGLAPNSPRFLYLLGMAMKSAFADRNPHMGDPPCGDVPLDGLMSKERAAYWHDVKHQGDPIHVSFSFPGSPDTTHVTTVDR